MTYYKQISKSEHDAPGLRVEIYTWKHVWMQHNDCHSYWGILRIDHSFYNMYDITDLNVVSKIHV